MLLMGTWSGCAALCMWHPVQTGFSAWVPKALLSETCHIREWRRMLTRGSSHHWALNTQTGSLVSSDILGRESVWKSDSWRMWSYMLMCSPLGWFGRPAWFSAVLPITTYGTRHFWGGWAYKCCCVRSIPSNRLIQLRNYWRKKKPGDSGHNGNVGGQLQVILVLAELQSVQSPKMGRTGESSVIVFYLFTSW